MGNSLKLVLEEHTEDDIRQYVKCRLEADSSFLNLKADGKSGVCNELTQEIIENARGVSLWVKLVVIDLLRGITNGDNKSELRKLVLGVPRDLVGYFTHMFDSLDPFYRQATAETLLITTEAIRPLSVLAITFYEREQKERGYALNARTHPYAPAEYLFASYEDFL